MSNQNKTFRKLSENLLMSPLCSVRLCYSTTPRPVTACNSDVSAVVNSGAASTSLSHSARPVDRYQPRLRVVLRVECWWGSPAALWEPAVPVVPLGPRRLPLRRSLSGNEECLTSMPSPNHLILCLWLMFACLNVQTTVVSKAQLFMT